MTERVKTVVLPLIEPVTVGDKTYESLTFRRMKAKDAMAGEGEKNQVRAGYLLFAAMADVPVEVIEELDVDDLEAVGDAVAPLMGKSASAAMAAERVKQLAAIVEPERKPH